MSSQKSNRHSLVVKFDWKNLRWLVTPRRVMKAMADGIRRELAAMQARRSFPNNKGNYAGKRVPAVVGALPTREMNGEYRVWRALPLSPDERFADLQGEYLTYRKTYANPPSRRRSSGARLEALHARPASHEYAKWLRRNRRFAGAGAHA